MPPLPPLPIDAFLPDIVASLEATPNLVLVAEPGAGKTTRLPRALLESPRLSAQEIWVLEPRRVAARLAATRVAEELGEALGERVGFQTRFEQVSGPRTRLRFLTEGLLTRRILREPTLPRVGLVVFDEFHERHLHSDLGLALLRWAQRERRPELKLIVMSATLDAEAVAAFLDAPTFRVPGRSFPVHIDFEERPRQEPLEAQVLRGLRRTLQKRTSDDVLVFLPGLAEMQRCRRHCASHFPELDFALLHGSLSPAEQDRIVRPSSRRRCVLSTNVAESSLTLPSVGSVIDSGLAKQSFHSPWSGLVRLETRPISRASAEQRAGRAGRVREGYCLRLYSQRDFEQRLAYDKPALLRDDLADVRLWLAALGVRDPSTFPFFESPPAAAWKAAETLLRWLDALDDSGGLNARGQRLATLPLHPRLSRLVDAGAVEGVEQEACWLAAYLRESEGARGRAPSAEGEMPSGDAVELTLWQAEALSRPPLRRLTRELEKSCAHFPREEEAKSGQRAEGLARALLQSYPDRVARRQGEGSWVFAQGGSGERSHDAEFAGHDWIVVVDAEERARRPHRITLAAAIDETWLLEYYAERLDERRSLVFDSKQERVLEVHSLAFGQLLLDRSERPAEPSSACAQVLVEALASRGPHTLWKDVDLHALLARLDFARSQGLDAAPLHYDDALLAIAASHTGFASLRALSSEALWLSWLSWEAWQELQALAPESIALPGRCRVPVHYDVGKDPWVASRLQDFFGLREGPRIARGRYPLRLELLAPNRRAVQVTKDLERFWREHYPPLRRELMRRYPRHAWPEDPLSLSSEL